TFPLLGSFFLAFFTLLPFLARALFSFFALAPHLLLDLLLPLNDVGKLEILFASGTATLGHALLHIIKNLGQEIGQGIGGIDHILLVGGPLVHLVLGHVLQGFVQIVVHLGNLFVDEFGKFDSAER